ncbi:MAG TPA: hypothetical protein DET40_25385 [Lentisphaeria bacterium]|nr:MAG: hypothetical protein A2X45_18580 [Lentisphaerae bacterium GWF2_50_93]HCE46895.1 hypothetical protein [Lentisphaeria bacterium]
MTYRGKWHGRKFYFGLHYDLHAGEGDATLGTRCSMKELVPMLKLMKPDFVQTDCKGHPGYTSWFSKVKSASVPPKLKKDALRQWREATKALGLPLHCHYSGIWDKAAGKKHPEWCTVDSEGGIAGAPSGQNAGAPTGEKMCPLGPYLDKLMIPQMIELIDRYDVDGFWIDGDLWSTEPCYCKLCRGEFTKKTGIAKPPVKETDPDWPAWWNFTRENFESYVTKYCDAVHKHKPGVLVCSNWLQTFNNPGEPKVPTDWISGDNTWVFGLDQSRCEARFLSTRGKPWDIMLWNFYCSHGMGKPESPWTAKPQQMLMQEASVILSFGGNVQIYENPGAVRDGRLIPWRQKRLNDVGNFVKKRRAVCQGSESIPQIAVLHSEHHIRNTVKGRNLMWGIDSAPVKGAVMSLLENHYGVDVLDEWALLPRLADFPAVVVPERHAMSEKMAIALKEYVRNGGSLVVSGAEIFDRLGAEFLGVTKGEIQKDKAFHVPAADGSVSLFSAAWRLVKPKTADVIEGLGTTLLLDDCILPYPAATINRVGKGRVAYIPADVFRDFERNRYPLTRAFIGKVAAKTIGSLPIQVDAPVCVDVAMRTKEEKTIIHLINRLSGIPNQPNNGAIDEIPMAGPITMTISRPSKPKTVTAPLEKGEIKWSYAKGKLTVKLSRVHIHEAVVIK